MKKYWPSHHTHKLISPKEKITIARSVMKGEDKTTVCNTWLIPPSQLKEIVDHYKDSDAVSAPDLQTAVAIAQNSTYQPPVISMGKREPYYLDEENMGSELPCDPLQPRPYSAYKTLPPYRPEALLIEPVFISKGKTIGEAAEEPLDLPKQNGKNKYSKHQYT